MEVRSGSEPQSDRGENQRAERGSDARRLISLPSSHAVHERIIESKELVKQVPPRPTGSKKTLPIMVRRRAAGEMKS